MNKHGRDYINSISKQYKDNNKEKHKYNWSDSPVQERIMRLGREQRAYELNTPAELEQIAIATLLEDNLGHKPV